MTKAGPGIAEDAGAAPAVVTAVVGPRDLDAVLDVLERFGARGVHVSPSLGQLRRGPRTETYKGVAYRPRLAPCMRVEAVAPAGTAAAVMDAIAAAVTRPLGDGDLFAVDLLAAGRPGGVASSPSGSDDPHR